MKNMIRTAAENILGDVIEIRREIHRHPETGMDTVNTAALVCRKLDELGIAYRQTEVNGIIADIRGEKGSSDQIVMLRADMDALALEEKTDLPFSSEEKGRMHACGHDMHTAMLVGTAKILNDMKQEFAGTVRLLFQPGEEISKGAQHLIDEGVLDGVSMALGIHMDPLKPVGVLSARKGPDWAAVDHFRIHVHGEGAHGATPQKGADATIAAAAIALNLQTMVSRECDPMHPLVVTIGILRSGTSYNIVSNEAYIEGTCRSFDEDVYEMIPDTMNRIVKKTAEALKCSADVEIDRLARPLVNDDHAYEVLARSAKEILDQDSDWQTAKQEMIGEDFALYAERVPAIFAHLGADGGFPLHSCYINFKEEAMEYGMAAEVSFALKALEELNQI